MNTFHKLCNNGVKVIIVLFVLLSFLCSIEGSPYRGCDRDEFQCRPGECIPDVWQCDGDEDCGNGKDEKKCDVTTMCPGEHHCNEQWNPCIPLSFRCDGDFDCTDRSDEDPAICRRRRN